MRTGESETTLSGLLERVPVGWTRVAFEGRPYGLSRVDRVGARVVTVTAEELGGPDFLSANIYRTTAADLLRSCEIPDEKVLVFLRGWSLV